jgi:hypothetical protein
MLGDMPSLLEYLKSDQLSKHSLTIWPRDNFPNLSLRWWVVGRRRHLDQRYRRYHPKIREVVAPGQS